MILRRAEPGDAGAVCEIANAIIRDTLITFTTEQKSPAQVAEDIRLRGPAFLVAEENRRVVGFATYGPFRPGPGYAHTRETSINLAAEARGRGVGRGLMQALEAMAMDEGVHVLVAGISGENPQAIAFHAALGFRQVGRMPETGRKAGRWLDLVLMQKILPSGGPEATDNRAGRG